MKVKLVHVTPHAENEIVYIARVSNPSNQSNMQTAPRLLKYLIKHKHWSPFEMASMCLEIETSRAIAAQILRHKSFSFQEFCMAGDTEVYFDLPGAVKKGKKRLYKLSLEDLYKRWETKDAFGNSVKNRIKNMNVRVFDESSKSFTHAHIKEVFKTGIKDIFEIELENGKKIKCTKEHKVLTQNGFKSLESAFGLNLIGNKATITSNGFIGCNGIPVYQDVNWLKQAKKESIINKTGLQGIADKAGVSYHTIRKWLKLHKLSFSKKEVAMYTIAWNKNKFGYKLRPRTESQKKYMRNITPRGPDHHSYKGGGGSERKAIANYFNPFRKKILEDFNYQCQICFKSLDSKTDLHHVKPVSEYPELALDIQNVVPVHRSCHMKHHGKCGDSKKWRQKSKGNRLTVNWSKIKSVKYAGKQMTYDLEIDHSSHNYVANGVVVHNSQRYADVSQLGYELYEPRRQDTKNRQNSTPDLAPEDEDWFINTAIGLQESAKLAYEEALRRGVAKECARFLLPLNTSTRLYMHGTIRSWVHYIDLRAANGTQKEHMDIANECKEIFIKQLPNVAEALEWK